MRFPPADIESASVEARDEGDVVEVVEASGGRGFRGGWSLAIVASCRVPPKYEKL